MSLETFKRRIRERAKGSKHDSTQRSYCWMTQELKEDRRKNLAILYPHCLQSSIRIDALPPINVTIKFLDQTYFDRGVIDQKYVKRTQFIQIEKNRS